MAALRNRIRVKFPRRPHISGARAGVSDRRKAKPATAMVAAPQGRSVMGTIARQRDIIDRRSLTSELCGAARTIEGPNFDRAPLAPPLKAALARGRAEIRRRFEAGGS